MSVDWASGVTALEIEWEPPASIGLPITSYTVHVTQADGSAFHWLAESSSLPSASTRYLLTNIGASVTVHLAVAAVNARGGSPRSESVALTTALISSRGHR